MILLLLNLEQWIDIFDLETRKIDENEFLDTFKIKTDSRIYPLKTYYNLLKSSEGKMKVMEYLNLFNNARKYLKEVYKNLDYNKDKLFDERFEGSKFYNNLFILEREESLEAINTLRNLFSKRIIDLKGNYKVPLISDLLEDADIDLKIFNKLINKYLKKGDNLFTPDMEWSFYLNNFSEKIGLYLGLSENDSICNKIKKYYKSRNRKMTIETYNVEYPEFIKNKELSKKYYEKFDMVILSHTNPNSEKIVKFIKKDGFIISFQDLGPKFKLVENIKNIYVYQL